MKRALLAAVFASLLAVPAMAQVKLQLVEVITSPERTEVLKGQVAEFEKENPGRHGRDRLAALGPGLREAARP